MKKLLVVLLFLLPFSASAAAPTDYVSCWDLEEASGARIDANTTNSNDLTDNNTVTNIAGKVGNAASTTRASSEYLSITDATQVGLDNISNWSYFVWVNYTTTPSSGQLYGYAGKRNTGDNATYSFEAFNQNSAGTQQFRLDMFDGATEETATAAWTPSTATWYHVGWTFQGSTKEVKFYVNGVQQGGTVTFTTISSVRNSTGDFTIGQGNSDGHYFNGWMDIAEYYNRVITGTEITDLYNAGAGVACTARSAAPTGGTGTPRPVPPIVIGF